jgi:MinD-like ATPase involved in chromosome partitioning or flagellar assembly
VSIHSFRGGTGKSNLTASLATLVAQEGKRVGVIDTDIQSPGIHVVFGLEEGDVQRSLNDYLWGRCEIEEAAYPVAGGDDAPAVYAIYLIPSTLRTGEIARVLKEGYSVTRLNDGFRDLIDALELDYLFIDTHPGLNEETLLSIAISDVLIVLMRPDHQDYQGTSVTVEVARRLDVPQMYVLVNKVPTAYDFDSIRDQISQAYGREVIGVLPMCDEMARLGSSQVFVTEYPEHPLSESLREAARIISSEPA